MEGSPPGWVFSCIDSIAYVGSKTLRPCSRRLTWIPFHARVLSFGLDFSAWFHFPRSETVTGGTETERIAQWDSWNARKFHFSIETFRYVHVFHGEPHDREAC